MRSLARGVPRKIPLRLKGQRIKTGSVMETWFRGRSIAMHRARLHLRHDIARAGMQRFASFFRVPIREEPFSFQPDFLAHRS